MSIIDTDLIGDGLSNIASKFHYGHHPSIIMWTSGPAPAKEEAGLFGGTAKQLESLLTADVHEMFNSFKFDAIMSEEHDAQSVVTSFPVSNGFLVSDHVINKNRQLKLTAVAANMQNSAMWTASVQGLSVIAGSIFNSPILPVLGGLAGTVASAFQTSDRIQSTYNLFNSFRVTGKKLYISTILGTYLDCVVTGLKARHDKNTSSILAIDIYLEELQVIGPNDVAQEAGKAMASMYDYSQFAQIAQSLAIGAIGGAPLPGLGKLGDGPTTQLSNLKSKLYKLSSPLSSVKGRI